MKQVTEAMQSLFVWCDFLYCLSILEKYLAHQLQALLATRYKNNRHALICLNFLQFFIFALNMLAFS